MYNLGAFLREYPQKPGYPLQLLAAGYGGCGVSASIPCALGIGGFYRLYQAHVEPVPFGDRLNHTMMPTFSSFY